MIKYLMAAALSTSLYGFPINPKLTSLSDNTWMILDSAGVQFDGHTAYSGGTYDRTNHQFLIFGGGHWDGWKNDVLAFDVAAGTWKSMYTPTPSSAYNCGNVNSTTPGMLLAEKMPASRHTWDGIDFIDHLGKMLIWSGATYSNIWSCTGNTLPADTWLYDYATNSWEYKNVARTPQPYDEGGSGAYDPIGKMYYALSRKPTDLRLWRYNPATDQWAMLSTQGTVPWDGMMITDRKRQVLHCFPDYYDIKTNRWSTLAGVPGGMSGGSYGYVSSYDEVNDALVHVSGGQVFIYHIAQGQWETLSPAGTPSIDGSGTYGRFFYDPVDNVHLFVKPVNYRARTWAYRYKGGAPAASEAKRSAARQPAILIAPNPAGRIVRLSAEGASELSVFDLRGRRLVRFQASPAAWDTDGAAPGVYFAKARIGLQTFSKKIILQEEK